VCAGDSGFPRPPNQRILKPFTQLQNPPGLPEKLFPQTGAAVGDGGLTFISAKEECPMELRDKNGLTEAEFLSQYRPGSYNRPSVTADIAVFRCAGPVRELLLIRRGGHPFLGKWALPGGFAREGEPVSAAAARELEEETHLSGAALEPVGLFSDPGRDPRMWVMSEAYTAVIDGSAAVRADDDAADAVWFAVETAETAEAVTLRFSGGGERFSAVLDRRAVPGVFAPRTEYVLRDSGGLAFDHAAIIACAMRHLGWLAR